jgi:hypothetical protein
MERREGAKETRCLKDIVMKLNKHLLALAALAAAVPGLGQGSIQLNNSSATLALVRRLKAQTK